MKPVRDVRCRFPFALFALLPRKLWRTAGLRLQCNSMNKRQLPSLRDLLPRPIVALRKLLRRLNGGVAIHVLLLRHFLAYQAFVLGESGLLLFEKCNQQVEFGLLFSSTVT